ncbi:carboxylesterase [Streptomyces sp. SAJ15]|nr:carboxylesterase [Streptomyces sp. SAJ15]
MTGGMALRRAPRTPAHPTALTALLGLASLVASLLAVAPATASATPGAGPADPARVTTRSGVLRGTVTESGRRFLGVPYAAPPVGAARWRPPRPVPSWDGEREATRYGSACAQRADEALGEPGTTHEDCLYLNVFTPPAGGAGRPVLVWFHGGGFDAHSATPYDASRLARTGDLIVVTVNYRLGPFGSLALPELTAEEPNTGSGNYGLLDQQAALRWVRDNATAFGGSPERVTLAGQSAGGLSVCAQLVSPGARGLVHRAALHSAPCALAPAFRDAPAAEAAGRDFAARAGCGGMGTALARKKPFSARRTTAGGKATGARGADVVGCLRATPAAKLLATRPPSGVAPWNPVAGTPVLPEHPARAIAAGRYTKVPVLTGSTREEGTVYAANLEAGGTRLNALTYPLALAAAFGTHAPGIARRYPASAYGGDHRLAYGAVLTDALFACPTRRVALSFAASAPRTHAYEFADPASPNLYALTPDFPLGAYHGAELSYLFDYTRPDGTTPTPHAPAQRRLSDTVLAYWARFATTGNPSSATSGASGAPSGSLETPPWRPLSPAAYRPLSLAPDAIAPRPDFTSAHHCDFWATVPTAPRAWPRFGG